MTICKSGRPAASVVVPAYNSKATVPLVLERLLAQRTELSCEIILVESSGDGTAEIVRRSFPEVRVIESPNRLYPGAARNRGVEEAQGRILLFIDSDCLAEPEWIAKMWRAHQDWDCAAVAGAILNANPETAVSVSSYMNEFSHFYPAGKPRYVDYLPSGNLSYKMDVFRRYGGFDANEPMYEDLIFNKTLSRSGEKLLFHPDIKVAHNHRTELREYLSHEFRRGKGAAEARRRGLLIGSSWVKHPILAALATPGLFLRKATVFPMRLMRAQPQDAIRVIRALPCFYLALFVWHWGFVSDVAANRAGKKEVAECTGN